MFRFILIIILVLSIHTHSAHGDARSTVLVVRPTNWESALQEWIAYRSHKYEIVQIDSQPNPYALRNAISDAAKRSKSPAKAILLCGDVAEPPISPDSRGTPITPTFSLKTSVQLGDLHTPQLVTDALYGDLDDDGCPEIAIGRLPAKSREELRRLLSRSITYETSEDVGEWRDRVHVTAGVGGFGLIADSAIEMVARRYLSEGIPDRFQLQMTYASLTSPYCPAPTKLKESFLAKLNRGGLFWVYIGHGWVDCLDRFSFGNRQELICSPEDTAKFDAPDGPPVAVLLACFTGAFDANVDCFAERLLAQPRGPIAVIAGSRVTMPYGLSQMAGEMMEACFRDKIPELGTIVLQAQRALWIDDSATTETNKETDRAKLKTKYQSAIEQMARALSPPDHSLLAERREHVRLMNLLGDPLLVLRQPRTIELNCSDTVEAGSPLALSGRADWSGTATVELLLHRDRLPARLETIQSYTGTTEQHETMQSNYELANHLVLWSEKIDVIDGTFSISIPIPSDSIGKHVIRMRMQTNGDWAVGTKRITIRRARESR